MIDLAVVNLVIFEFRLLFLDHVTSVSFVFRLPRAPDPAMSFFFNRGRNRTNAAELARQTYDLLARVDVANNPKVGVLDCR